MVGGPADTRRIGPACAACDIVQENTCEAQSSWSCSRTKRSSHGCKRWLQVWHCHRGKHLHMLLQHGVRVRAAMQEARLHACNHRLHIVSRHLDDIRPPETLCELLLEDVHLALQAIKGLLGLVLLVSQPSLETLDALES